MAGKLYPPIVAATIPAFYAESDGTVNLTVPFSMNKAVGASEVGGLAVKIKDVDGIPRATYTTADSGSSFSIGNPTQATFEIPAAKVNKLFSLGSHYKIQLAYISTDGVTIGYYSTVGTVKMTTKPKVFIDELHTGTNTHNYNYTGVYSQQGKDSSEKLYSYCFTVYDANENIINTTGEQLHNTSLDTLSYEAHESWLISEDLALDSSFYIEFTTTSINGIKSSSPRYRIIQRRSVAPDIAATLNATLDYDNGYVKITMQDTIDPVVSGTFLIARAASNNNYKWEEMRRFDLQSMVPEKWYMCDYTAEQGITYKYSLQQYNENGIYSDRLESNEVLVDFEDAFLYDGEKQLRIRFNPKVTSFKNDLQEQKVETIGSKYPFILRNGHIFYKEFPISGLISYQMDEAELFMGKEDLGIQASMFDLTTDNIMAERLFKMKVLEWLTNGEVKLFRSPAEGNFIVRLLNVSFSPTDSLNRMLHTFSCTAYEIAEFNHKNLEYYGLVDPSEHLTTQTRWLTVDSLELAQSSKAKRTSATGWVKINSDDKSPISISLIGYIPGTLIRITDHTNTKEIIEIGATGAFQHTFKNPIRMIEIQKQFLTQGACTYGYQTKAINMFGTLTSIGVKDVSCQQIIGNNYQGRAYDTNKATSQMLTMTKNVFDYIEDVRSDVLKLAFCRAKKRDVKNLFVNEQKGVDPKNIEQFYWDEKCQQPVDLEKMYKDDDTSIYMLRYILTAEPDENLPNYRYYVDHNYDTFAPFVFGDGYDPDNEEWVTEKQWFLDGYSCQVMPLVNNTFSVDFNEENVSVKEIEEYEVKDTSILTTIVCHAGCILEVSYPQQIKTYQIEDASYKNEYSELASTKALYEQVYDIMMSARSGIFKNYSNTSNPVGVAFTDFSKTARVSINGGAVKTYTYAELAFSREIRDIVARNYQLYIEALNNAIHTYKVKNGLVV